MEVKKRIVFSGTTHQELVKLLRQNNIPFQEGEPTILEITNDTPLKSVIESYAMGNNLLCTSETLFTKTEIESAEWLSLRSQWRNGYPQPEEAFAYEDITYTRSYFCQECGCGLVQVQPFRLKKEPKWGRRHFMMLNWIDDELFVSAYAKGTLQNTYFSELQFSPVNNKDGSVAFPDVYQLVIPCLHTNGINPNSSAIDTTYQCRCCGKRKYHPSGVGKLEFKKEIFDNAPNIVKTSEVFGWGKSASRQILIRQQLYRFIVEKNLDRGLIFEPITLL